LGVKKGSFFLIEPLSGEKSMSSSSLSSLSEDPLSYWEEFISGSVRGEVARPW